MDVRGKVFFFCLVLFFSLPFRTVLQGDCTYKIVIIKFLLYWRTAVFSWQTLALTLKNLKVKNKQRLLHFLEVTVTPLQIFLSNCNGNRLASLVTSACHWSGLGTNLLTGIWGSHRKRLRTLSRYLQNNVGWCPAGFRSIYALNITDKECLIYL